MNDSRRGRHLPQAAWALVLCLSLLGWQAGCSSQEGRPQGSATVAPHAAATLTAWPTPPPLLTRVPTLTAVPQPIWTSAPEEPMPAQEEGPSPEEPSPGAPPGTRPPPIRLQIPRLGLDVAVIEVAWLPVLRDGTWQSEWVTADGAAGHHRNSANPGERGNMILSGHHNIKGEVFRDVSEIGQPGSALEIGDELIVQARDGSSYTYVVEQWERFSASAPLDEQQRYLRYLEPTSGAALTLITCWPYEANTHRVVVVATLKP